MTVAQLRLIPAALLLLSCIGCQSLFDPSEGDCKGNYSYYEVALWDQKVHYYHVSVPGIISYRFDPTRVCLAFGVEKWSVARAIETRLRELDIPRDAVYIYVTSRPQFALLSLLDVNIRLRGTASL